MWPSKLFSSDLNEIWYESWVRRVMHNSMPCGPIQAQGQGHVALKVRNSSIFARDSICCKRAYAIAIPSVCLSDTRADKSKTIEVRIAYALSIGAKIIYLGWPWTADTHSVADKMRLSEPTTKKWMKIDPYYQPQRCRPLILVSGNIKFVPIFAGVLWRGGVKRQWGNRKRRFSWVLDATSSAP